MVWAPGFWNHIILSISAANGARLIINGEAAVTDADTTALFAGGTMYLGFTTIDLSNSLVGEMRDVALGTDDLSGAEEAALLQGIVPVDATQYYPLDEGSGTTVYDNGTGGNDGTVDSANTWQGTGAQSTITLSQIPSGYGELILILSGVMDNTDSLKNIKMTFNGDTGANYDWSDEEFGAASSTTNGATSAIIGAAGNKDDVAGVWDGVYRIFNRAGPF